MEYNKIASKELISERSYSHGLLVSFDQLK